MLSWTIEKGVAGATVLGWSSSISLVKRFITISITTSKVSFSYRATYTDLGIQDLIMFIVASLL